MSGLCFFDTNVLVYADDISSPKKKERAITLFAEHLRQQTNNNYYAVVIRGQRYDTGIPYGFMETQIALGLNGIHRTEISQAIARILASQNRL